MKLSYIVLIALLALTLPQLLLSQASMPRMTAVTPDSGKVGDVLSVAGEHLDKGSVAELYLTDGKNDLKVPMTEQAATLIKFRVPAKAKAGRFSLMVLTPGKDAKLIEQPVRVTIQ